MPHPTTKQGFALLEKDLSDDAVGGYGVFRYRAVNRPDFGAVVPITSKFDDRVQILFDNTPGFSTGIAVANPFSWSIPVKAIAYDDHGRTLGSYEFTLGANAHQAFDLGTQIPATRNNYGVFEFTTTDFGVAVLGLRFNATGPFTSIHGLSHVNWIM